MRITSPAMTSQLAKQLGASLKPCSNLDALAVVVAEETESKEAIVIEKGTFEYEFSSEALAHFVPELPKQLLAKVK